MRKTWDEGLNFFSIYIYIYFLVYIYIYSESEKHEFIVNTVEFIYKKKSSWYSLGHLQDRTYSSCQRTLSPKVWAVEQSEGRIKGFLWPNVLGYGTPNWRKVCLDNHLLKVVPAIQVNCHIFIDIFRGSYPGWNIFRNV